MRARSAAVVTAVLATLVGAQLADAAVRRTTFTADVRPGDEATLTAAVAPAARGSIAVMYDTTVSHARGLGAKSGSRLTWPWTVGTSTHAGRWPVGVNCGESRVLRLKLHVVG